MTKSFVRGTLTVSAVAVAAGILILARMRSDPGWEPDGAAGSDASSSGSQVAADGVGAGFVSAEPLTAGALSLLDRDERIAALIDHCRRFGFAASLDLLAAFHGDQELYLARKVIALLGSQVEPVEVYDHLRSNDPYLLSDPEVLQALMSAPTELLPVETAMAYAAFLPKGSSKFQAYNYLSQIMANPGNSHAILGFVSSINDAEVLSYVQRNLPDALLRSSHGIEDAARIINDLEALRPGFHDRNSFIAAGARLAQASGHGLEELYGLAEMKHPYARGLVAGYSEELARNGYHLSELVGFAHQLYRSGYDGGELLQSVFRRALAADSEAAITSLTSAGIEDWELDALITREFINFAETDPRGALAYIGAEDDPLVRDHLMLQYGLMHGSGDIENIKRTASLIEGEQVKKEFLRESTFGLSETRPRDVFEFIMEEGSSEARQELIEANFLRIALSDLELGGKLALAIEDSDSRGSALTSLREIAGDDRDRIEALAGSVAPLRATDPELYRLAVPTD